MRVLIVTFPWKTHLYNLVPLAWSLRTAGHEVRVASEPELIDAITGAGLTAVGVGSGETMPERVRRAWREGTLPPLAEAPPLGEPAPLFDIRPDRERLSWQQLTRLYDTLVIPRAWLCNDTMMDDLVGLCREWRPDLVLWNAVTFAGSVAAAAVGAVHARVLYSVDVYTRMREDYLHAKALRPPEERVDGLRDWLSGCAGKYGCEFSEELVNGQFTIDPLPESFRLDHQLVTFPMQYVPYNGPAIVPPWLGERLQVPRVLMTFGVSMNDWPELYVLSVERVQEILDAVGDLEMELVLTLPADVQRRLHRVPDNTRLVEFVPLAAILPTCAAVVHHGGAGSFGCAVRYGVPQLMISQALDAPLKFQYLERSGAGISINPADVDGPRVRAGLVRLLDDPSFQANADRLREEVLSMPSPNELVQSLEDLVADAAPSAVSAAQ
ncbi:activator-dependent family glycosyltransferase [Actinobacteria bacterium YIM 96077]|uniref:Glycosyl transferase n=1 Tax=Phytoactinopolyspora halophila TaxID=1981511 RepID=A0A329QB28_9ACTN|nr:activator-dependent family glycosyltransferase [Phytoactinopolyspora halophila]AYY12652.1 activator-dependent family glycosyltransferase [Actinobacteria bacterium YIM 96077]RAW09556.1 glycosyl transferase [Phytoactinopolyspora halophila]